MAKGREGMAKRARERARLDRQEAKRIRRETLAADAAAESDIDEGQLMEDFRLLNERHAAGEVESEHFEDERHRNLVALGVEVDEE
jgi:hypothetical protein